MAHRYVLNIDYHKRHWLAESALLRRLLGILCLSRIILILAAESQIGWIEVLVRTTLLAGLLAGLGWAELAGLLSLRSWLSC